MRIEPLTGVLGAEIFDVDLKTLTDADFATIREAFADHSVIAIRDQELSPDDHLAFARRWASINVNRFFAAVPGHPQVAMVLKEPDQHTAIGEDWHTDHSYDQAPATASLLYAVETPASGGDTAFSSTQAAYDALSDGLKNTLEGLSAWHSSRHAFGVETMTVESHRDGRIGNAGAATQDALHPMVIRHPLSGRPSLYVNPDFTVRIDGWTAEESEPLLGYLYAHCARAEFGCRLRWRNGTLAMWDNRATWHKAINDYYGHRRLMHRVTIDGPELAAYAAGAERRGAA